MSTFQTNISLLNKFLKQFASCFSKKQMAMFTLLTWNLCLVAWTLTPTGSNKTCPRVNGDAYLTKILETKPTTFNEIKQAVNSILEFASTNALSKNEKLAD
ncbi:MAG TPA: hypothetical protein VI387_04085 [Candidatus Brocadiales bacterium]|nr:hypothetical protein [Candidatus Brocadiales bacterium]